MLRLNLIRYSFSALHPYLQRALISRKLWPLTTSQQQALALSEANQNIMVNENTGSGKTLCYLLPIMNSILTDHRKEGKPWGGVVLTLTKELCVQVYRQVRLLDPENRVKVSRIGSISHFSSIVQKLNKKETAPEDLDALVKQNVINTMNQGNWDLVISTPQGMVNAIGSSNRKYQPKIVAIDEADLLMTIDQNVAKDTHKLIANCFGKRADTQYILAASSFPPRVRGKETKDAFESLFKDIKMIESSSKHKLPAGLNVQWVDLSQTGSQPKFEILSSILTQRIPKERVIVFCNSADSAQKVAMKLELRGLKPQLLTASLSTQERTNALSQFERKSRRILVTTNLASRGLDFDVPLVVQYEMATNVVDYINRAGRTARFNRQGTITSFVEQQDRNLFIDIKQSLENNLPMDQMFTRKRSYSKSHRKPE